MAQLPIPAEETPEDEIRGLIVARLREKGALQKCAMCGVTDWIVGALVPLPVSSTVNRFVPAGDVYPFVTVRCRNCGNTHFVNLLTLGFTNHELLRVRFQTRKSSGAPRG